MKIISFDANLSEIYSQGPLKWINFNPSMGG